MKDNKLLIVLSTLWGVGRCYQKLCGDYSPTSEELDSMFLKVEKEVGDYFLDHLSYDDFICNVSKICKFYRRENQRSSVEDLLSQLSL